MGYNEQNNKNIISLIAELFSATSPGLYQYQLISNILIFAKQCENGKCVINRE